MRRRLIDMGYRLLRASHLPAALEPTLAGVGAILSLHGLARRCEPHFGFEGFSSAEFLETALDWLLAHGYRIVSLDELHAHLTRGHAARRLLCFTFDDGYRDNLEVAYPMFKKRQLPFTIYVAADFIDRKAFLWTYALRDIVLAAPEITFALDGHTRQFSTDTFEKKQAAFAAIKQLLLRVPSRTPEENFRHAFSQVFESSTQPTFDRMFLAWDDLRSLSQDPLVTIGSHSVRHVPLNGLTGAEIKDELVGSRSRIEHEIGKRVEHFAYPFGSRREVGRRELTLGKAAGYKTMTTARVGTILPKHARYLYALPRIPFNAALDREDNLALLLSGLPSTLFNLRRVVTV